MNPTPTDIFLRNLIQAGDMIECNSGTYESEGTVSERYGNNYYHAIVLVFNPPFYIPIHCYAIKAVYRNGVCLYERGVTPLQKGLWE